METMQCLGFLCFHAVEIDETHFLNEKCEIERSGFQGKFEKVSEKKEGSGPMTLPQASLFIDF